MNHAQQQQRQQHQQLQQDQQMAEGEEQAEDESPDAEYELGGSDKDLEKVLQSQSCPTCTNRTAPSAVTASKSRFC